MSEARGVRTAKAVQAHDRMLARQAAGQRNAVRKLADAGKLAEAQADFERLTAEAAASDDRWVREGLQRRAGNLADGIANIERQIASGRRQADGSLPERKAAASDVPEWAGVYAKLARRQLIDAAHGVPLEAIAQRANSAARRRKVEALADDLKAMAHGVLGVLREGLPPQEHEWQTAATLRYLFEGYKWSVIALAYIDGTDKTLAALRRECADNPELAAHAERLLSAHKDADIAAADSR